MTGASFSKRSDTLTLHKRSIVLFRVDVAEFHSYIFGLLIHSIAFREAEWTSGILPRKANMIDDVIRGLLDETAFVSASSVSSSDALDGGPLASS